MGWIGPVAILPLAQLVAAAQPADLPFAIAGDRSAAIDWSQRFASANDDWINDLVLLQNGNLMAVGFLNRRDGSPPSDWTALAAELRPQGSVVDRRSYGEGQGIDAFWSMVEAGDGGRTFAGFTTRIGQGGIDALMVSSDADDTLRNERAFGGAGYDRFTDVAGVTDGHVFLGHSQAEHSDKRRIFIVKTDLAGDVRWQRIHDAPESWGALYIEPVRDGFVIAGGTTIAGDGEMFAMKVDSEGRKLWRKRVGTPDWDEVNHGLVIRPDGRIVLTGYTHRRGEDANDLVAATLSPSGEVERIERFGGAADDRAILAKADKAGRIWVVGHTASAGAGGVDLLLARLDGQGRFESAAITLGTASDDHGTAVLPLSDGSLRLAGYSTGLGGGGQDAFVVSLGAPSWDRPNPAFRREVAVP